MGPGSFDPGSLNLNSACMLASRASMGPGSFDPGSEVGRRARIRGSGCFNGAGVFRPRKCSKTSARLSLSRASMGPGSFDPGSSATLLGSFPISSASMGPGSFDPGSVRKPLEEIGAAVASMGPGSFDPGSDRRSGRRECPRRRFNGAGVFRPRKYLPLPLLDRKDDASMGPGSFDPGSAGDRGVLGRCVSRFNGAGVFRPRKSDRLRNRNLRLDSFNGAGVFRPRKCRGRCLAWATPARLQWGRGLSTPEVRARPANHRRGVRASMGPGSFDPGSIASRARPT